MIWWLGALVGLPLAVHGLLRDMADAWILDREWVKDAPEGMDWGLAITIGAFVSSFAWPLVIMWQTFMYWRNREKRRELKRKMVLRRNERAFLLMKDARQTIMRQKQLENRDAIAAWTRQWNEALRPAHERLLAEKASAREIEARRRNSVDDEMVDHFRSQGYSQYQAERQARKYALMYDDLICPHGVDRSRHCFICP